MHKRQLAVALVAAWIALWSQHRSNSPRVDAGTAVRMEIEELVREADLVFEGRVLATHAVRDARGRVSTHATLSVARTFLGEPFGTRTIDWPGGVMPDGSGTLIPGVPRIEVGEDVLLVLSRESANGLRMPVGLAQGKFRVVHDVDGRPALSRTQVDLELVDRATGVVTPAPRWAYLDRDEVIARIEAAVVAKLHAAPASHTEGR